MLLNGIIVWRRVGDLIDNFRTSCARRANPLNFVQPHQSAPVLALSIQEPPPKRERQSRAANFRLTHYPLSSIAPQRAGG
jgi:hypothetical protein